MYAPIVLFAYNRLDCLKATIESLKANKLAKDSDLFVFVDGAKNEKDIDKINSVKTYLATINGFKTINLRFSPVNKGLANSVIEGVSDIINKYEVAIVLEDDLILSKNFLNFINQGLNLYKEDSSIFSICGYSNKIKIPKGYNYDAYFWGRSSSWGWGTWKDRWNSVDWEVKNWPAISMNKQTCKAFNKYGGSDCFGMLKGYIEGKNNSWAIRFCFSQYIQNKYSLFPVVSKVKNEGFTSEGTHCKIYNRFKSDFDFTTKMLFTFPPKLAVNKKITNQAIGYNSLFARIKGKLFTLWLKGIDSSRK